MTAPLDTPGSPSAVEKGCRCPVEDNLHGEGYRPPHRNGGGAAIFWIDDHCQLHAPKSAGEILEKLSQAPYTKEEVAIRKLAKRT